MAGTLAHPGESVDIRKAGRRAAVIDLVLATLTTLLVWPFPVMRRVVSAPVHAALVLACIIIVAVIAQVALVRWKATTPGMYFAGLRANPVPTGPRLLVWALVRAVLLLPAVVSATVADPVDGAVARVTKVRVIGE